MPLTTVRDLFLAELRDLHSTEKQLVKALGKMAKGANTQELANGFLEHLEETKVHQARLEQIIAKLGESVGRKKCKGVEGIIAEGDEQLKEEGDSSMKDAALIGVAQRAEHYEIAGYGCAARYADILDEADAATMLRQTLEEEKSTDEKLTQLAQAIVHPDAVGMTNSTDPELENAPAMGRLTIASSSSVNNSPVESFGKQQAYVETPTFIDRSRNMSPRSDYDEDDRGVYGDGRRRSSYQDRDRDEYGQFTSERGARSSSRYDDSDDDYRGSSRSYRSGGSQGSQDRERDEYGQFTSGRGGRSSSRYDDDYADHRGSRGGYQGSQERERDEYGQFTSERGSGRSSWSRYDNDRDDYREYSRGSRGGNRGSQGRERDEYGQFMSERSGGQSSSRYDDDDDDRGSSRSYSSGRSSRGDDDDDRSSGGGGRGRSSSRSGGRGRGHTDSAGRHYSSESWERAQEGRALGGQHSHGGR